MSEVKPTRVLVIAGACAAVALLVLALAGVGWAARPALVLVLVGAAAMYVRSRTARRAVRATARAFYDSVPKVR